MIGDAASGRAKRAVVGGGVLLAHALLVLVMMLARPGRPDEARPQFVTMMIDLSRQQPVGDVPIESKTQALQLQKFAPQIQDIPVEHFEIEPEVEPVESPVLANTSPPASAPATGTSDAGFSGQDSVTSGNSGRGNGLVLLQRVVPTYPAASMRRGEQGITSVVIHVAESGRVDEVRVARSSGSRQLDKAAVEAFYKWKFQKMPKGTAPDGMWMSMAQRFVLYAFKYSRLAPGALEEVFEENLKPKSGVVEEATAGSQEALMRFIAQVDDQTFDVPDAASRTEFAELRATLEKWGAVKTVWFTGMAGSGRWVRQRVKPDSSGIESVEVSWNRFEARHENATSVWLVAMDRNGEIWAVNAARAPWN